MIGTRGPYNVPITHGDSAVLRSHGILPVGPGAWSCRRVLPKQCACAAESTSEPSQADLSRQPGPDPRFNAQAGSPRPPPSPEPLLPIKRAPVTRNRSADRVHPDIVLN